MEKNSNLLRSRYTTNSSTAGLPIPPVAPPLLSQWSVFKNKHTGQTSKLIQKCIATSFIICIALVCVGQLVNFTSKLLTDKQYEVKDVIHQSQKQGVPWLSTDLDRHLHPCQNSSNVGGYQLPLLSTKPYCSEQYLLFFPAGQFNNVLRSFIVALILASAQNRTVVLTDDLKYNVSALINTTDLCAVEMSYEHILHLHGTDLQPTPCVSWGQRLYTHTHSAFRRSYGMEQICPQTHHGLPIKSYDLDVSEYRYPKHGSHNVHCIAPLLPHFPNNTWITHGKLFASGVPKSTYMSILKRIDVLDEIKSESDKFIQEKFQSKEYVGLHVRGLDGNCERWGRGFGVYLFDYLNSCRMSWDFVSEKIRSHGYDPNTVPIFLATDNQRPQITQALLSHPNVHMWKGNNGVMMDTCLLTKSSLFIGVPTSSMSFHVALWRELHGHSMETNVLAGYQETGLLDHLFLGFPLN